MRTTLLVAGLLSSALLASAAMAQGQPPAPPAGNGQAPTGSTDSRPADGKFITQEGSQGVLRLSDIMGQNAVGPDNKTIGEVKDVVLGRDGRIAAYVVEVGGALGIGGRSVAVPAQSVQIDPVDSTASTGTVQSRGLAASTAEGQRARSDMQLSRVLTPGKIVVTIPADQLKSAPAYNR
jgi:Spy/CpxP family protein refolding chaperone